jgi:hypothetical protein
VAVGERGIYGYSSSANSSASDGIQKNDSGPLVEALLQVTCKKVADESGMASDGSTVPLLSAKHPIQETGLQNRWS